MLRPVIDEVHGLRFIEDGELEPTIVTRRVDSGLVDWATVDVSYGFRVYDDVELAEILCFKAENHVYNVQVADVVQMHFEVNLL